MGDASTPLGHVRRRRRRCPSRSRRRRRRRRGLAGPARPHERDRERRRARHGRQRRRRRRPRRPSPGRSCRCPVVVVKGYDAAGVRRRGDSLVFAVSFSGDTEETLEAATEAADAGRHRSSPSPAAASSAELAPGWGAPVVPVPDDIPQPRAALGALAVPPLVVLEEIGLFPGRRRVDRPRGRPAAAPARRAGRRRQPGARHWPGASAARSRSSTAAARSGRAAARRWKTQINENAKVPAFWNAQPELCHNEMQGWGQHGDVTRQVLTPGRACATTSSTRRSPAASTSSGRWFDEVVAGVHEVRAEGEGDLAQLLDLVLSATSSRCTWPTRRASTRAPCRSSTSSRRRSASSIAFPPPARSLRLFVLAGLT